MELCLLEHKLATKPNDKIYKVITEFVPGNYYACQLWGCVAKTVKRTAVKAENEKNLGLL